MDEARSVSTVVIEPRRARLDDAGAIAAVFQAARAEAMPWLPVLHTPEQDLGYFRSRIEAGHEVWVAEVGGVAAGFAAMHDGLLDHLFVAPGHQRRGVGDALFARAKASMPGGFRFYVFQQNHRARRFYEARGGVVLELREIGGEERLPDALYEWRPAHAAP